MAVEGIGSGWPSVRIKGVELAPGNSNRNLALAMLLSSIVQAQAAAIAGSPARKLPPTDAQAGYTVRLESAAQLFAKLALYDVGVCSVKARKAALNADRD
jgi:hypothetical protein